MPLRLASARRSVTREVEVLRASLWIDAVDESGIVGNWGAVDRRTSVAKRMRGSTELS